MSSKLHIDYTEKLFYSMVTQCSKKGKCLCIRGHAAKSPTHELASKCLEVQSRREFPGKCRYFSTTIFFLYKQ